MTEAIQQEIFERANQYLNSLNYEAEMISLISSIKEYDLCYAIGWCEKQELNLYPFQRRKYIGMGRVLVSKINAQVGCEGSAPFVDWIHQFELSIQGLEEYFVLIIEFSKRKLASLKTLLNLTTPQIMKIVKENATIEIEKEGYELKKLKAYMDTAGIACEIKLKQRKQTGPHNPFR